MEASAMHIETDQQDFGKVALIMGGSSAERDISLLSGNAILTALKQAKVNVTAFEVQQFSSLLLEQLKHFDIVFIALHGAGGEDGTLQGLLDCIGVPYTGSGVLGCALSFDKVKTKQIWQSCGIPTPKYWALNKYAMDYDHSFETFFAAVSTDPKAFPLFLKPAEQGSSVGTQKIVNLRALGSCLESAFAKYSSVLIEQFIDGEEYTVFIMNGYAYPVVRINAASGNYDYDAKYITKDTQYSIPCGLAQDQEKQMQALALKAFDVLGCTGWGRADIMMDQQGNMYFLEINTVPGMTATSLVPKSAAAAGLSFQDVVLEILRIAKTQAGVKSKSA